MMEHASAMRSIARLLLTVALFSASAASHAQSAASVQVVRFNIGAQAMKDALKALANQSDIQIIFTPSSVKELRTEGIQGQMTTDEALDLLLKGTGLEFERKGDVVVVRDPTAKTTATADEPMASASGESSRWSSSPIRLAQSTDTTTRAEQSVAGAQDPDTRSAATQSTDLGTMTVTTGSLIRGVGSAGAPLLSITRDDIDRSGYATAQDVVEKLPQSYGGGAIEDRSGRDGGAGLNSGFGAGVNLRGLGNDSTLVLLNGRRLSPAGGAAAFVDVSMIPVTAIERIEVLTDGASALYGSDAIGGVVNFIMLDDYAGAETRGRFGSASHSDSDELQFGQVLGTSWDAGNILLAYEYHDRTNLASAERDFASDSDLTRFGGDSASQPLSNPGNITDFVQNFAIPSGQDGTQLTSSDLLPGVTNLQNQWEHTDILPRQERHTVFLTGSQSITDRVSFFGDARFSRRKFEYRLTADADFLFVPSTNPFFVDPFGGSPAVFVQYSFVDDLGPMLQIGESESYGATAGVTIDMGSSWQMEIYGSYNGDHSEQNRTNAVNRSALEIALADPDSATAFNPFADGSNTNPQTLNAIRGFEFQEADSELWLAQANADGDLFAMSGGQAKLAVGVEYREESLEGEVISLLSGDSPSTDPLAVGDRQVSAAFAELFFPFVTATNPKPGLQRLEVSVAGRYEDYSDFGSTADPRLGVIWSPVGGLAFRGTIGTSFKAPLLSQLVGTKSIRRFRFPDPNSATGFTNMLVIFGLSDDLGPEEADTWSVGMDLSPADTAFDLQLNYFSIEIDGRIRLPVSNLVSVLRNDAAFASVLTRNPSAEAVNTLFNDPDFVGTPIPADQIGAIVDARTRNIATSEVNGIDLSASYLFETAIGKLGLGLSGTYLLDLKQGVTDTSPLIEQVDTLTNPADKKARATLSWSNRSFSVASFVNYIDSYTDKRTNALQQYEIDSWTTVDMQFAYATGDRPAAGALAGITASISVLNLFDEDPPFVNGLGIGYDATNADAQGRFIAFQISKEW